MPNQVTLAGLRTLLAGGPDRQGGGTGPVVCLLHGYGASGDDLYGLWRVLDVPREVRFAFPEAPISLAQKFGFPGFAWWDIDIERFTGAAARGTPLDHLFDEEPPGMAQTRQRALEWLAALLRHLGDLPLSKVVLGGFSQGSMLATDLVLRLPQSVAGLVVLSGAPVDRAEWRRLLPAAQPTRRYQSHGMEDPILPFAAGLALHEFLGSGPFPGDLYRFHGGHEISQGVLGGLGTFLTEASHAF